VVEAMVVEAVEDVVVAVEADNNNGLLNKNIYLNNLIL